MMINWELTQNEWDWLLEKYGKLIHFLAWNVAKSRDSFVLAEDIYHDLLIGAAVGLRSYKRQAHIENYLKQISHLSNPEVEVFKINWANRGRAPINGSLFKPKDEENLIKFMLENDIKPIEVDILPLCGNYVASVIYNCRKKIGEKVSIRYTNECHNVPIDYNLT